MSDNPPDPIRLSLAQWTNDISHRGTSAAEAWAKLKGLPPLSCHGLHGDKSMHSVGTLSLAIQGRGAIPEGSHSYSHQQINFIRRLPAFANATYYDLTVVNTYPYILFVHPAKHATDAATIQNLTETLLIPFRFPDNINIE